MSCRRRMPPDAWGIFDKSGSPDDRPGYPPVPDVDFAFFPSACIDLLPEYDAARVLRAFERGRAATMLWLELRRGFEPRHGPRPAARACVLGHARRAVRHRRRRDHGVARRAGRVPAQRDPARDRPGPFAADHEAHAGAPATNATATLLRSYSSRISRRPARSRRRPGRTPSRSPADARLGRAGRRDVSRAVTGSTRRSGRFSPHSSSRVAPPAPTTPSRCSSHPIRPGPRHRGTFTTGSRGSVARPVCASTPPPDGTATQPDPGRPFTSSPPPR